MWFFYSFAPVLRVTTVTEALDIYPLIMNNFKNLLIATLTGLLALSLFTQPAQSATNAAEKAADKAALRSASTAAKAAEYDNCLSAHFYRDDQFGTIVNLVKEAVSACSSYRP